MYGLVLVMILRLYYNVLILYGEIKCDRRLSRNRGNGVKLRAHGKTKLYSTM